MFLTIIVALTPFDKGYSQSPGNKMHPYAEEEKHQTQKEKANTKESKIRQNDFLDQAKSSFENNEADVYQQGDLLIIRLKGLSFSSSISEVTEKDHLLLSKVYDVIKDSEQHYVLIEGHTDSLGDKASNALLSKNRALAVGNYFKEHSNGDPLNIKTTGLDSQRPLAANTTANGRAQNRRVEIIIFLKDESNNHLDSESRRDRWPLL